MADSFYLYVAAAFAVGFVLSALIFRSRKSAAPELPAPAPAPAPEKPALAAPALTPEQQHASGLFLLSMLQREGRFVDFVLEDVAGVSDDQLAGAARVVHEGCRKVLKQYLSIEPVLPQEEGATVDVPAGFDAGRIRLTGNVAGAPPFKGALKHHGWAAKDVKLPQPPTALDVKILAPAEVELP
ncbi:MAG: DUF2760 domain-containing protein [Archangiaceae bacterium]|nr:DUF2760 domain-containing protein [Archangiaceae bacterium]